MKQYFLSVALLISSASFAQGKRPIPFVQIGECVIESSGQKMQILADYQALVSLDFAQEFDGLFIGAVPSPVNPAETLTMAFLIDLQRNADNSNLTFVDPAYGIAVRLVNDEITINKNDSAITYTCKADL